jgi:hypothetical protein
VFDLDAYLKARRETVHSFLDAATIEFIHAHKTADLFAAAARMGAIAAGGAAEQILDLGTFGHAPGMTFQVVDAPYAELLGRLPLEQALNVDETGHKDNGEKFWTWVFRADLYVLFKIDKTRGSQVLLDVLGEEFNGVPGCDYFSAYRKYMGDFSITVQFCIAQ